MSYNAEISRLHPACFLFLIDQSGSMQDLYGQGTLNKRKADVLADIVNRLLSDLTLRCAKEEGVRDYFHVGVIGYGKSVGPAFVGTLAGKDLVPISEVANQPARIEERQKKVNDGAGGLVELPIKFPIWFDPVTENGTPMCSALARARDIVQDWLNKNADCYPPIVMNITDGEATDGDPSIPAQALRKLSSVDGNVLLYNLQLSSKKDAPIQFPDSSESLPDEYAQTMFNMSDNLTDNMLSLAQQEGISVTPNSHGYIFNADADAVIRFLNIGTRPSNLR
jgi:hypothetical protein